MEPARRGERATRPVLGKEVAMKVRDVMVRNVVAIEPSASLAEAARRMCEANVGILPVVEAGEVLGVIADRDLVVSAVASDDDPVSTPVGRGAAMDPRARSEERRVGKGCRGGGAAV